jgi:hypothetical protein
MLPARPALRRAGRALAALLAPGSGRALRAGRSGSLACSCLVAAAALSACSHEDIPRPLVIRSSPVAFAREKGVGETRGKLVYRGGVELASSDNDFGGLSAMLVSSDGRRFVAVSDEAHWVTGSLEYQNGRLSGVRGETIAPLLGLDGRALVGKTGDAEGLASADGNDTTGDLFVSFEGDHRIWRYPFGRDGVRALPVNVPLPRDILDAPRNGGLEGITEISDGLMFGVAERYRDAAGEYRAWFVSTTLPTTPSTGNAGAVESTGSRAVSLRALAPFAMTDVRALPNGDVLTLERRYSAAKGVGIQLRRIPRASIAAAAQSGAATPLDGELVAVFDAAYEIDNMEGLAVRTGARGETLVYAVSDDNFNRPVQRTLLLMYELLP